MRFGTLLAREAPHVDKSVEEQSKKNSRVDRCITSDDHDKMRVVHFMTTKKTA